MSKNNVSTIVWRNERRKLSDLIPWENNPRQISRDNANGHPKKITIFAFLVFREAAISLFRRRRLMIK